MSLDILLFNFSHSNGSLDLHREIDDLAGEVDLLEHLQQKLALLFVV